VSAPKRGLGRGLGALLGNATVPVSAAPDGALRDIPVDRIRPNPFQPRKSFDPQAMQELEDSINEYGVLVPIIVRKRGEEYEIVAGERRWRACATLQRAVIPAIVRESDDRDSLEVAIVENLQREDLNPLEEAAAYSHLIEEYGLTQEEVARRLGKSRPTIANAVRLLTLPDAIKAMLADGRLTAGHARALLAASGERRMQLAHRTTNEGLSVRDLERLAGGASANQVKKMTRTHEVSPDDEAFESQLRERFGTFVTLVRSGAGGRIEIRFVNEDELIRLGDLLLDQA
jgi:ParB family transcriptional regulator, chromosome partitioning protein